MIEPVPISHSRLISPDAIRAVPQNGFSGIKVLVVGDLMLDQYVDGEVHRISPEAPVPVLSVRRRREVAGGAANVALNILGLRAEVTVVGAVGSDPAGQCLLRILSQSGADTQCIVTVPSRPTTTKIRVISGNHQIVRLDEEVLDGLAVEHQHELMEKITRCLDRGDVDAVILSDYGKGVLCGDCPQRIIETCRRDATPVLVDPKREDYNVYHGATCVTPNLKEFFSAIQAKGIARDDFSLAGLTLREQLQCAALLVTQGADGMTLFMAEQVKHVPALAEEVFDVSGAGDTVIATLAAAVGKGLAFPMAIEIANAAASIVVRRAGTTPVTWNDLSALFGTYKSHQLSENQFISMRKITVRGGEAAVE